MASDKLSETQMETATPMLRQYLEIKKLYPGTILFFRLGDFYEMFNEDALVGSRELEITLTARHKDTANPIPMCGVPHHSAANYIARLVKKGYRVAICEQTRGRSRHHSRDRGRSATGRVEGLDLFGGDLRQRRYVRSGISRNIIGTVFCYSDHRSRFFAKDLR